MFFRKLFFCCTIFLSGCTYGWLYTDIHEPLMVNANNTPVTGDVIHGRSNAIQEPLTTAGLRVEWSSWAPGDVAKSAHRDNCTHADVHRISILFGIWKQTRLELYCPASS